MGSKTLHPLVSVIDLSDSNLTQQNIKLGFYAVLLRECRCGDFLYGRQYYDYSDGTLLFLTPGETIAIDNCLLPQKGRMLAFHPDLIGCTSLGQNIQDYSFFSYHKNEALHISAREKQKVSECFDNIREEYVEPTYSLQVKARHRLPQQNADNKIHRVAAGLLHTFQRTPVYHPLRSQQETAHQI